MLAEGGTLSMSSRPALAQSRDDNERTVSVNPL